MKLYRYRPLSDFLFKELHYQEIYFASYSELNDPLDLTAPMEFIPENIMQIEYLIYFLCKTTLKLRKDAKEIDHPNNNELLTFINGERIRIKFRKDIFKLISAAKKENIFVGLDEIENIILESSVNFKFEFDINSFRNEVIRLTRKFLENSSTACFSETNNNFLMWSHYASKHSGICLEFTLERFNKFPYQRRKLREYDYETYMKPMSSLKVEEEIIWDRIKKVSYQKEQPFINFFDFSPVFDNEHDCDLIGLSKSWTHGLAYELENVFSTKTTAWEYENEWRAIEINFGDIKAPEERVRHFPIESLTSIFFGLNTTETVKERVYKIFKKRSGNIKYFDCTTKYGNEINFKNWKTSVEE